MLHVGSESVWKRPLRVHVCQEKSSPTLASSSTSSSSSTAATLQNRWNQKNKVSGRNNKRSNEKQGKMLELTLCVYAANTGTTTTAAEQTL